MTTVAIVGRPNVGKSTLFNRFIRKRIAIVDRASGVTRDRLYGTCDWQGRKFTVIDTGGVDIDTKDALKKKILEQIKISIKEADLVIFITDVTTGLVPMDKEISRILRHSGKDVIVAVNKVDNEKLASEVHSFCVLGWDRVVGISALHGLWVDKLLDEIIEGITVSEVEVKPPALKVAVIGKPNVGKSTFVNTVLKEPRMIVDEKPGTTRDAVDIRFNRNNNPWLFIDTAGMRKRKKLKSSVEYYSVNRAYKSIDRSDVVILMIDGWEGIWKQDAQLLDYIVEHAKPCVIAVNKWDLVTKVSKMEYMERIRQRLAEHWYIPAIFISSLRDENINKLLDKVEDLYWQSKKKIPTSLLNKLLQKLEIKIYYGTQTGINPPKFLLFVKKVPDKQNISYILNQLRKGFGLEVPIRLQFRPKLCNILSVS